MEKCQFCGFLNPMFSLFRKASLLYTTSKIVFWRFIFAIYDVGIQGLTRGYWGLQGITRGYKGLPGVTMGDRGWQGVRKDYRNFFLTRTFPDTFSWSILYKNQSWRNLKFSTKTMDQNVWKNFNFAFFLKSCFIVFKGFFFV